VAPFLKGVCIVIIILIPVYECFLDSVFWNKHVHMTLQNVVKWEILDADKNLL
jgi:hypothetical protein